MDRPIYGEAARLDALRRANVLDTPPERSFDRLTRLAARFLDAPVALVSFVDRDRQFFKSCLGLPEPWASRRETPLTHSFCRHVVDAREPLIIADAREHSLVRDNAAIGDLGVVAYLGVPLITADGQALGSLCAIDVRPRAWSPDDLATLLDLAESVTTEVALRQMMAERARGERRHRLMMDNIRDHAIFTTGPDGVVDGWNVGATNLLGYSEGEALGLDAAVFFTPEDRDGGAPEQERRKAAENGHAEDTRWHLRKGGQRFFATGVTNAMRDEAGNLVGYAKVMRDITHRKRNEDEAERLHEREREAHRSAEAARAAAEAMRAEMEEAGRAKDRFLAMLSHELRTPINPVLLTATAMLVDPAMPEGQRATWEMIRDNIGLEARLIDDLLDVTRTISGKMPYDFEPVDVHDLIRKTLEIVRSDANARRIDLSIYLEAEASFVNADTVRLTQAFWNLIKNGVKFSEEGGTISVLTRNQEGRLLVEFEDHGIGIEPAALTKVFNAFEQVEDSATRRYGGLGLGLAICKSVVEAHGGRVVARSLGKGRGATFTIDLATVPANGPGDRTESSAIQEFRSFRLLFVEDDATTCRIMAKLLRNVGHDVTTAVSFESALEAASASFDLVISDIGLPGRSGFDLMSELRRRHGLSGIALTGFGMEEDIRKGQEAGFVGHVTKPVDFERLEVLIQRFGGINRDST